MDPDLPSLRIWILACILILAFQKNSKVKPKLAVLFRVLNIFFSCLKIGDSCSIAHVDCNILDFQVWHKMQLKVRFHSGPSELCAKTCSLNRLEVETNFSILCSLYGICKHFDLWFTKRCRLSWLTNSALVWFGEHRYTLPNVHNHR